jgi:hypothetical protein
MTEDNVKEHPYSELLREAEHERGVVDSPEGQALQEAIFKAVRAYSDFLDRHGLIMEKDVDGSDECRLKASQLLITCDFAIYYDITLKDGALDRVYGKGRNPDPEGRGPPDIPHAYRPDDGFDGDTA